MNRFFKACVLSTAVAATMLSALPAAEARDWRRHHHHSRSNGDAVAAGVIGLAAGALIGGALSQPRYYEPEPTYVIREPRPARTYYRDDYYRGTYEPWSPEWYRYCSDRYRSFDARTGTFIGYDGLRHFCQAN